MSRMWVLATTVALLSAATPGVAVAATGPDFGAVDRFVADYADNADYPGVAFAITEGDQVLHVAGFGHDSAGAAITGATPMPVASVSKSFTALAVMQLVEAGKVALDRPVHDYVPDFRVADPRGAAITVRELLNQTSGITDGTLHEKSLPQPDSLAGAVIRAQQATLAEDPGTKHDYTNTNFQLAARLVEVVAREPFADYLRRHVFEPAGMRSTTSITRTPRDLPGTVAKGHIYAYGLSIPITEPDRFVAGSDGVVTTAADMARWLIAQRSPALVSAASLKAMHTSSDPRWTYGMGWDTSPDGRVRHNGIWFTFTAGELLLPSGYGVAVLTDSGFALGNEGTFELEDGIASVLAGGTPSTGAPTRLIIDLVLALLTALCIWRGIRGVRRSGQWASKARPTWQAVAWLAPRLLPLAVLLPLPYLLGSLLGGGRDVTYPQIVYYSVALFVFVLVLSLSNLAIAVTRVVALARSRAR